MYKIYIRSLLLLTILVSCTHFSSTGRVPAAAIRWVIQRNSTLSIAGKSNVNSFRCSIGVHNGRDTIRGSGSHSLPVDLAGSLHIEVLSFDCHSKLITKDLGETLRAVDYPTMVIRFINLQSMPDLTRAKESIRGEVEVQLAGVVKRFELTYAFTNAGSGYMVLNGRRRFSFSDFNLQPPCKLGCLIKIKGDFDVNFQLVLLTL